MDGIHCFGLLAFLIASISGFTWMGMELKNKADLQSWDKHICMAVLQAHTGPTLYNENLGGCGRCKPNYFTPCDMMATLNQTGNCCDYESCSRKEGKASIRKYGILTTLVLTLTIQPEGPAYKKSLLCDDADCFLAWAEWNNINHQVISCYTKRKEEIRINKPTTYDDEKIRLFIVFFAIFGFFFLFYLFLVCKEYICRVRVYPVEHLTVASRL